MFQTMSKNYIVITGSSLATALNWLTLLEPLITHVGVVHIDLVLVLIHCARRIKSYLFKRARSPGVTGSLLSRRRSNIVSCLHLSQGISSDEYAWLS